MAVVGVPGHAHAPAPSATEALESLPAEDPELEMLIGRVHPPDTGGWPVIEVHLLNRAPGAPRVPIPPVVTAELDDGMREESLNLLEGQERLIELPPGGFATVQYRLHRAEQATGGTTLSIPAWRTQAVALLPTARWRTAPALAVVNSSALPLRVPVTEPRREEPDTSAAPLRVDSSAPPPSKDRATSNAFLRNLSAYAPIYAVYGPGPIAPGGCRSASNTSFSAGVWQTKRSTSGSMVCTSATRSASSET